MALIFAGGVLIGGLIGWLGTEFLAASRTVWVLSRDDYGTMLVLEGKPSKETLEAYFSDLYGWDAGVEKFTDGLLGEGFALHGDDLWRLVDFSVC